MNCVICKKEVPAHHEHLYHICRDGNVRAICASHEGSKEYDKWIKGIMEDFKKEED